MVLDKVREQREDREGNLVAEASALFIAERMNDVIEARRHGVGGRGRESREQRAERERPEREPSWSST